VPGYGAAYGPPPGYGPGPGGGYGPPPGGAPGYAAAPGPAIPGDQPGSVDVVGSRVGQYIIDALLTVVPLIVLMVLATVLTAVDYTGVLAVIGAILWFFAWIVALGAGFVVYAWWPTTHGGQTPGMKFLGLKIIREEDGGEPTLGQNAIRWLLFIVDGIAAGLVGLVIMVSNEKRQRLGDMAAHTLVVRV
jgi:uncharacterized RDD family membrane protein YckC